MLDYLSSHISYLGIIFVLVLTGIGLPIPEELPVVLAGAASAYGKLNPWLAFLSCVLGALGGDCVMYGIGYRFGHGALKGNRYLARFLKPEREARVERLILQHGLKVLILARFMVGLRSAAYLAAGTLRLPFKRFIVVDALCATTVIGVSFGLSYRYARSVEELLVWIRGFGLTVTVVVLVSVVILVLVYWQRRRNRLARIVQRRSSRANREAAPPRGFPTLPTQPAQPSISESETLA